MGSENALIRNEQGRPGGWRKVRSGKISRQGSKDGIRELVPRDRRGHAEQLSMLGRMVLRSADGEIRASMGDIDRAGMRQGHPLAEQQQQRERRGFENATRYGCSRCLGHDHDETAERIYNFIHSKHRT